MRSLRRLGADGIMLRCAWTWLLSSTLFAWGGCAAPQRSANHVGTQSMMEGEFRAVFDAAEVALIDAGFDIDRRNIDEGLLTTKPVEAHYGEEPAGGVQISSRARLRRVAQVQIRQQGSLIETGCKVLVQEQTTRAHQLFSGQQSAHDHVRDTPIDRDAGTTSSQYTVWRTLRRDRAAERAILSGIAEQTGR